MRIVVALGGNALLQRGERPDAAIQLAHVRVAAEALAPLTADHDVIICHGNGPQVAMLALESQADLAFTHPYPLDDLVAQTQGMIGYRLAQSLRNAGVTRPVLSLITQTVVDPTDPAFARPAKFVGPGYSPAEAEVLAHRYGWVVALDGDHWRRVVASPDPQRIVEQDSITRLVGSGTVVICGGGGGAPVTEDADGRLTGVEAVVDKDYVAAVLAIALDADRLLVLTDIGAVMQNFGTSQATPLSHVGPDALDTMHFPAGSMAPKVEACRRFVAATGRSAAIGSLSDPVAVLDGVAGTTITPRTPHTAASLPPPVGDANPASSREFTASAISTDSGPSALLCCLEPPTPCTGTVVSAADVADHDHASTPIRRWT